MSQADRLDWVDVARGLGIILVVYAHALRGHFPLDAVAGLGAPGLAASGLGWAVAQDRAIYAFHMPLFFMLSGLFLWPSVGRGRGKFLTSRWWQMIWPYLLWSTISACLELGLARFVNSPISSRNLALIPVEPIEQYWFLYALLIHQLVVVAVWPSKPLLAVLSVAGLALVPVLGGEWFQIRAFDYLPYVAVGVLLAPGLQALAVRADLWNGLRTGLAGQAGLAVLGWAGFAALLSLGGQPLPPLVTALALGLSGSAGLIGTAMIVAKTALAPVLAQLGQASLAIYLAHTIFSAGVRIGLKLAGIAPDTMLSFLAATTAGLIAPWLIWHWARRYGLTRALGFGGAARRALTTSKASTA